MAAEGMVHALEIVHDLLIPGGILLDIHPAGDPPSIDLIHDQQRTRVGYLLETDGFVEYFQASAALSEVQQRGLFRLESQASFEFAAYAPTIDDLHAYLDENWSDAQLAPEVIAWCRQLAGKLPPGQSQVVMREHVHISRLRPQKRPAAI